LVGVSTLESLAFGAAAERQIDAILAVLDARRGEVFAAGWELRDDRRRRSVLAPQALRPETLAALIPEFGARPLAVGDGAVEFRQALEHAGALIPTDDSTLHRVSALSHSRLATSLSPSAPDEIHPEYLRLPDAEIAHRAARQP
jgi:tRNA threonylcarbamoyladenosine biosynthesis protein TsaB